MNKPKVGILTTFYEFSSSYSLCSVVENQLTSLVKHGYKPVLFVHDNFDDNEKVPEGVEIRRVVPRFLLIDYSNCQDVSDDFDGQVEEVYKMLEEEASDIDIMLEHDLIFQGWFLPYCVAIHKAGENLNIKWFHWIHSVPTPQPANCKAPHHLRFRLPNKSKIVYLNNYHLTRVAEAYNAYPKDVRIVYNPVDARLFWNLDPFVKNLIEKYDILSADIIQTYPVSTPRMMTGKQLGRIIDVFAQLKKLGKSVRLIVCNAHANDKREKQTISEAKSYAVQKGLCSNEIIFTSLEEEPKYEKGVPREIVSNLFMLSNLFIFPSISENCSLILLEAMLNGNLMVLNDSVGSMREFGAENALYFKFGGRDENVEYNNKEQWDEDVARIILSELNNNKTIKGQNKIRKRFNHDWIFKNQVEPLFYEK